MRLTVICVRSSSYMMTAGLTRDFASRIVRLCLELFLLPVVVLPLLCLLLLLFLVLAKLPRRARPATVAASCSYKGVISTLLYVVGMQI